MQSCVTTAAARCDGLLVATDAPYGQQAQTQAADRYWAVPGVEATCLADTASGLYQRWLFATACRPQVEILLTEFWDPISGPIFPNRGDQERFWKITRRFVEELSTALKTPVVNAVRIGLGVALCARCGGLQATGLAAWRGEKGYLALQHRVKGATDHSGQKGACWGHAACISTTSGAWHSAAVQVEQQHTHPCAGFRRSRSANLVHRCTLMLAWQPCCHTSGRRTASPSASPASPTGCLLGGWPGLCNDGGAFDKTRGACHRLQHPGSWLAIKP